MFFSRKHLPRIGRKIERLFIVMDKVSKEPTNYGKKVETIVEIPWCHYRGIHKSTQMC
jgi:hypothetical protein